MPKAPIYGLLEKPRYNFSGMEDLKLVYQATSKEIDEDELLKLDEKWGSKYPIVLNSWNNKSCLPEKLYL